MPRIADMATLANRRNEQGGFSLLEAIVAMVLIASLGASLFSWLANSQASLHRVEEAQAEQSARLNILEYCKALNPTTQESGEHDFGAYRISWRSETILPLQDGIGYPGGRGLYEIGLYKLDIKVFRGTRDPWFDMALEQVGYRKVRESRLQM
jgi:general secretion pathway protein I